MPTGNNTVDRWLPWEVYHSWSVCPESVSTQLSARTPGMIEESYLTTSALQPETTSIQMIFDEEIDQLDIREAVAIPSYHSKKSGLYKQRRKIMPPFLRTLSDVGLPDVCKHTNELLFIYFSVTHKKLYDIDGQPFPCIDDG